MRTTDNRVMRYRIVLLFTGITHIFGFEVLSKGKNATQSTVRSCISSTSCGPDKAVDGDRNTCMRTTDIGLSSTYKTVWWTVDLGANYSIYSISIDFKDYKEFGDYEMRQRGRFAGFSLYLSYTPNIKDDVLCYKNTLPLPPLKFNTTCIGYGRYVIYYNERLDGVSYPEGYQTLNLYTELCEVTVQGCVEEGFYGSNCSIHCPINCQNQRCNIVNGACLGCFPGYVGEMCEGECAWGFYGMECKKKCGHCKRNTSCNHVTGNCDRGCAAGWIGKQCNQQCKDGTYGPGCAYNCSYHCLNKAFCNKENGFCEFGCSIGYSGNLCKDVCPSGFFGQNCRNHCSKNCINGKCSYIDGACTEGCSKGYTGIRCLYFCQESYYGENCSNLCPTKCRYTCHHVQGTCIEDEASTGQWKLGFSVSATLNILLLIFFAAFITLNRKKLSIFFQREKIHQIARNSNKTNIGPANVQTNSEKPSYEDLNTCENKVEYQKLNVENKIAYENLAFI